MKIEKLLKAPGESGVESKTHEKDVRSRKDTPLIDTIKRHTSGRLLTAEEAAAFKTYAN